LQQENMVYYSLAWSKPATQAVAHIALQEVVRNIKENGNWRYYEEVVEVVVLLRSVIGGEFSP
jgi:predicted alternative tryptophan synthase beta-subunit